MSSRAGWWNCRSIFSCLSCTPSCREQGELGINAVVYGKSVEALRDESLPIHSARSSCCGRLAGSFFRRFSAADIRQKIPCSSGVPMMSRRRPDHLLTTSRLSLITLHLSKAIRRRNLQLTARRWSGAAIDLKFGSGGEYRYSAVAVTPRDVIGASPARRYPQQYPQAAVGHACASASGQERPPALCATSRAARLLGRTFDAAIGAEHAAVPRFRAEDRFTPCAFVKELARLGRHHLDALEAGISDR